MEETYEKTDIFYSMMAAHVLLNDQQFWFRLENI